MSERNVLLVHGAWHGPWCWDQVRPLLEAAGLTVHTVALSSCGYDEEALGDLYADATLVRDRIEQIAGPVVVLGHSYGGQVITEAATAANVTQLVYVSAFMLDVGQSLASVLTDPPSWQIPNAGGTALTVADAAAVFYNDCDAATVTDAVARIRPHSISSVMQPLTQTAWSAIPSTYVICTNDQAIPPIAQEMMSAKAINVERLTSGHSPFLSIPRQFADLLVQVVETQSKAVMTPTKSAQSNSEIDHFDDRSR